MNLHRLFWKKVKLFQYMLLGCLLVGFTAPVLAEDLNIAFVDGNQILQLHQPQITQRVQGELADQQQQFTQSQDEFETMIQNFQRDEAIMSQSEREQQQRGLESKQQELQQLGEAYQQAFAERGNQELMALETQIQQIVSNIAAEQGYDLILQRGAAIYFTNQYTDITDRVIAALDQAQ